MVSGGESVRVWEDTLSIPTYVFDELDQHPDLFVKVRRWNIIYPYPRQDNLTKDRQVRTYRAVHLESRYLHLIVCPDLGGHLYSLLDKTSGQEAFYVNDAVRPVALGLRGAWIPLGIEWNFPVAHSPTTLTPVSCTTRQNPDGSASIIVGEVECLRRMEYTVTLTLHPDRCYLQSDVLLCNRTDYPQSFYYWANAAVSVDDNSRFIIPVRGARGHGFKGKPFPWPKSHGVDYSWHKNIQSTYGMFGANSKEEFFGAYNTARDAGVVHVADYRLVPGKKLFDWGVREAGKKWAQELTENSGPYAELQAGVFESQSDYELFPPQSAMSFTHYWVPVKKMGGFVNVNRDAAVNLEPAGKDSRKWRLAVNTTRELPGLSARLVLNGEVLWECKVDVGPERPLRQEIELTRPAGLNSGLTLELSHDTLGPVLSYRVEKPSDGKDAVESGWLDERTDKLSEKDGWKNAQRLTLQGLSLDKLGFPRLALASYKKALAEDPGYSEAQVLAGLVAARGGEWQQAKEHFTNALGREHSNSQAHYYLGVAFLETGDLVRATDEFWVALRTNDPPLRNHLQMGRVAMLEKDYAKAADWFAQVTAADGRLPRPAAWQTAALRHVGQLTEAAGTVKDARTRLPLSFVLAAEEYFLARDTGDTQAEKSALAGLVRLMDGQMNYYLETACDYIAVGLLAEAMRVLELGIEQTRQGDWVSPLLYYLLGWCQDDAGNTTAAKQTFRRAAKSGRRLAFPMGPEMERAFRRALKYFPQDTNARILLGYLLYGSVRDEEAIRQWRQASRHLTDDPVLWWCIGSGLWHTGDVKRGIRYIKRAIGCAPETARYRHQLDQMLEEAGMDAERLKRLTGEFRRNPEDDTVRMRLASLHIDCGDHERALDLLVGHHFSSKHGVWTVTRLYQHANVGLGEAALRKGDARTALKHFQQSMTPLVSLGEDWSRFRGQAKSLYYEGLAYEALGKASSAKRAFRQAGSKELSYTTDLAVYRAMALAKLGKKAQAEQVIGKVRENMDQAIRRGVLEENYCDYIRSLIAEYEGKSAVAKRLMKKALAEGWRPSNALMMRWRMGIS